MPRAMMGSSDTYDTLPYFYSDQYDVGMEYTGYVAPTVQHEVVVSGSLETPEFVVFWTADGYVSAVMAVNTWDRMSDARSLIRSGRRIPRQEWKRSAPDGRSAHHHVTNGVAFRS